MVGHHPADHPHVEPQPPNGFEEALAVACRYREIEAVGLTEQAFQRRQHQRALVRDPDFDRRARLHGHCRRRLPVRSHGTDPHPREHRSSRPCHIIVAIGREPSRSGALDHFGAPHADRRGHEPETVADDLAVRDPAGRTDLEADDVGADVQARPAKISGTPPEKR